MIYSIIEAAATITDFIFIIWYIPRFLSVNFYEKGVISKLPIPVALLIFEFLSDKLFPGFDFLYIIIAVVAAAAYALLICRKQYFKALFASISYVLIIMFFGSIVYMVMSAVLGDKASTLQGAQSVPRIIYLVICKLSEFAVYLLLLFMFGKTGSLNRKGGVFFLVYLVLTIAGLGTVTVISANDEKGTFDLTVLIITAVLTLSLFFVFFFVRRLMEMQKKEFEYSFIEEKISADKMILEESNAALESLKRIRHDLKNHFTILKGMLENNDPEAGKQYIDEIYSGLDTIGDNYQTGSPILNYLINAKFSPKPDIHIRVTGDAGILGILDESDAASLMGNLLENALEAVEKIPPEKEKRVELSFVSHYGNKMIECKNTVNAPVLENNKELKTTKRGAGHGYGNRIVASIVDKYNGFIEYSEQDGVFCVQILIPVNDETGEKN